MYPERTIATEPEEKHKNYNTRKNKNYDATKSLAMISLIISLVPVKYTI
jgi:hypothetical protein